MQKTLEISAKICGIPGGIFGIGDFDLVLTLKEDVMVEISEAASQQIADYFKDRDVVPIRIFLNEGG